MASRFRYMVLIFDEEDQEVAIARTTSEGEELFNSEEFDEYSPEGMWEPYEWLDKKERQRILNRVRGFLDRQ